MPCARSLAHVRGMRMAHDFLLGAFDLAYAEADLVHTAGGASKTHVLWSLGHLSVDCDTVIGPALGLEPQLPAHLGERFLYGTKPVPDASLYPPLAELRAHADASFHRVVQRIAAMTDAELDAPVPPDHPLATFFGSMDEFLRIVPFHVGYHLGQVSLLRVSRGLPGLFS